MAKKPLIPTDAELEIANRIWSGLSGLDSETASAAPAKVTAAFEFLHDVAQVGEMIRTEQPKRLEPYAADLISLVTSTTDLDAEQATAFIGTFFSSPLLARMLADVASGNLDPVAATPRKAAAKKAPAKKAAAPAAPPAVEEPAPAPVKKAPAKKAAAAPKAAAPAAPAVEPVVVPVADEVNDFADEPVAADLTDVPVDPFDDIVAHADMEDFVDEPVASSLADGLAAGATPVTVPAAVVDDPDDF